MSPPRALYAPAVHRNREPILAVLRRFLPAAGTVIEVGSGTGEHAVWLAAHLPGLDWQPSDCDPELIDSIAVWREESGLANLRPPLAIDVTDPGWADAPGVADGKVVAVLAVNLIHIAPWQACCGLMEGAARLLGPGSVLYLYGAYRVDGATAPSNQAFDRMLRAHDPAWGVRDLESVARVAETHGFALAEAVAMPSNNLSAFFSRRG